MSLFVPRVAREAPTFEGITAADLIPARPSGRYGSATVTEATAMRHSAVWACLRLRANLISTFPVDVYRRVLGVQVEVPKPPVLTAPGGEEWGYLDWMWASQNDLDRCGNAIGLITETNALGLPARIELQATSAVSIRQRPNGEVKYKVNGKDVDREKIWHERQYRVSGMAVGLSPVAHAALSIGEYLSMQQFVLDWYGGGGVPKARMRNTAKKLRTEEREMAKSWYRDTIQNGDLLVTGLDWEYDLIQGEASGMEWIEGRKYGVTDISRFFDCPSDLIEAAVAGSSVTYANMTQRNLQFLVMSLQPAIVRREWSLTNLLPRPRYVKLNTDALMRMDPKTRADMFKVQLDSRQRTPTEVREKDNYPPLTPEQIAEITQIFGPPKSSPQAGGGAGTGDTNPAVPIGG